jgi:hypothetical protein
MEQDFEKKKIKIEMGINRNLILILLFTAKKATTQCMFMCLSFDFCIYFKVEQQIKFTIKISYLVNLKIFWVILLKMFWI